MPITQQFSDADIQRALAEWIERQKQVLARNMLYVAEMVTNQARATNSYKDQTGNLRSSLGCIVVIDGKIIESPRSFETVKTGDEGAADGRNFAYELAKKIPKGVALIAVAGMNYAQYVSARGYDVLDSAELLAKKLVPKFLAQLGYK